MRTRIAVVGVALVALVPFISSAQSLAELHAQIEALIQQVTTIEAQIGAQTYVPPPSAPVVSFSSSGSSSGCVVLSRVISLGASGSDVSALQRFLNAQGHLSASPSGYFGELTRTALQSFQARNGIISSGTAATTGYGATGPRTRALIQSLSCGSGGSSGPIGGTPTPVLISGAGIPCIAGNMGIASGASITLYDQQTVAGGACRAQIRQCINGVLTGDTQFRFNTCSVVNAPPERCRLDGETLLNGESGVFYSDETVDFGESCSSIAQERTCRDGKLSGTSRYKYSSCKLGNADKCEIDGITLSHGSSRTFFNKKIVAFGETCTPYIQSRTCQDGELSGASDYKYTTCSSAISNNCTLDGVTTTNGASRVFYSSRTGPTGNTCASTSQSRVCSKGVFNGNDDFGFASCTAASCTLDGATVASGKSQIFYSATSVPFNTSCSTIAKSRTCTNGNFPSDTDAYNKANCAVGGAASCSYNSETVANTQSRKFYKQSNVAFNQLCDTSTNMRSKTCTNGSWINNTAGSADFALTSCTVGNQSAASCTLTAEPSTTIPEQDIKFSWTTKDATSGTLLGSAISTVPSGSRTFGGYSSTGDRTVTLSVSGPGGAGQCSANVKVQSTFPPTCTLKITKVGTVAATTATNIAKDSSVTVQATATDSNELTVSFTPDGPSTPLATITSPYNATATYSPSKSGTLKYVFSGPGGICTKEVAVSFKAPTCTITGPTSIKYGDSVTLGWTSTNAEYLTISSDRADPAGSITLSNQTETKTHTFNVFGPGGQATCSKTVTITSPLKVVSPGSGSFQKGEDITITWEYPGIAAATRVYLVLVDLDGVPVGNGPIYFSLTTPSGVGSKGWTLTDNLGGTSIRNGQYKIRAVAYTATTGCSANPTTCAVVARADSGTVTLNTGIAGTVIQNLANALFALESALVSIIGFLTP